MYKDLNFFEFWNKYQMNTVDKYLKELFSRKSDLDELLAKFKNVIVFKTSHDREQGLLKYDSIPDTTAFLFKFEEEKIRKFHTIGMKFVIDINFFDRSGKLVRSYKGCKPGDGNIYSEEPSMYVVENLSGE